MKVDRGFWVRPDGELGSGIMNLGGDKPGLTWHSLNDVPALAEDVHAALDEDVKFVRWDGTKLVRRSAASVAAARQQKVELSVEQALTEGHSLIAVTRALLKLVNEERAEHGRAAITQQQFIAAAKSEV